MGWIVNPFLLFQEHEENEKKRKPQVSEKFKPLWSPADHVCRFCGSRIMVRASGGLSVGEVYKCFTCGRAGSKHTDICWCGQRFKGGEIAYRCLPTRVMEERPEVRELLDQAFRACGVNPEAVEVGVVSLRDYNRIEREAEARRAVMEEGLKAVPKHEQAVRDVEKALEEEKKHLGTPLAAGLYLEKVWRDYLARGESHLFVRALMWKLLAVLEGCNFPGNTRNPKKTKRRNSAM